MSVLKKVSGCSALGVRNRVWRIEIQRVLALTALNNLPSAALCWEMSLHDRSLLQRLNKLMLNTLKILNRSLLKLKLACQTRAIDSPICSMKLRANSWLLLICYKLYKNRARSHADLVGDLLQSIGKTIEHLYTAKCRRSQGANPIESIVTA
jgi:hypothetical protein